MYPQIRATTDGSPLFLSVGLLTFEFMLRVCFFGRWGGVIFIEPFAFESVKRNVAVETSRGNEEQHELCVISESTCVLYWSVLFELHGGVVSGASF